MTNKSEIILYQSDDGKLKINVEMQDETVWLSQTQLAELYQTTKQNINKHIKNIFDEKELPLSVSVNKKLTIQDKGGNSFRRNVTLYNLDMIISLGYRINSKVATAFRKWATERLKEYIIKGFTLDDERLKQNGGRYFKELLQRIRDIRSSERNLWQQVCDIYATSIDYNKDAKLTKEFFATVQNKMHYAVHNQTVAEVIYNRVDATKPMVGMTNFKGDYVTKEDTHIAKNYLNEKELQKLNLLVEQFLGYAELQALEQRAMTMQNWKDELDRQLKNFNQDILDGKGIISHERALNKADAEYDKYRKKELENYESDFDRAIIELTKEAKKLQGGK